ncbi:FkbM family methyltransferase [Arcobacter sp. F2176]|uniref:FkbM family methyltransferase n=1 Tax=Arcobacter sp. F2176 TaxID=2044511 RepID=UPI0013E93D11|nr:FkbM family methyltransferase [Arcobacter sp. F2176]
MNYIFTEKDNNLYKVEQSLKMQEKSVKQYSKTLNTVKITTNEVFWPSNISDTALPWLHHEIFDSFENNPSSYNHPCMEIDKVDWIIDAGCCEGYFPLFAFQKNSNCKVIAFEPLIEMEEALVNTFSKELKSKNMILINKALGKETGKLKFFSGDTHLCDSKICLDTQKNDHSYDVEVTTIDLVSKQQNITKNGMIKMDIEGAEMDALSGATQLLKTYKPKLAIAVYHEYENATLCREIILKANPSYNIEFRGEYCYFEPPRPYMLFAW